MSRTDYSACVFGFKGSGKSTLLFGGPPLPTGIVQEQPGRVFIFDRARVCEVGAIFETAGHLSDYLKAEARGVVEVENYMKQRGHIYCLRPATRRSRSEMLRLLMPSPAGSKRGIAGTYVFDEAHTFAPSRGVMHESLEEGMQMGGNQGMSFIWATRRFKKLHRTIREQSDVIVAYQQQSRNEAGDVIGDRRTRVTADFLLRLGEHDFTMIGDLSRAPWTGRISELENCKMQEATA